MPKKTGPTAKQLKNFFKLISRDLDDELKTELAIVGPNASFDAGGQGKVPALVFALQAKRTKSARVLLEAGADVNAQGPDGAALHHVRDLALAKELLARKADVHLRSQYKKTPLHEAASAGDVAIVELLLAHGAEVDPEDAYGATPYGVSSSAEVRALLKKHGAKGFGKGGGKILTPTSAPAEPADVDVARGALGVDRAGRVWFAGYSGLFVLEGDAITRWTFEESFAISSIKSGPRNTVYFATNWGLLCLDGGTFTLFSSTDSELFDNHIVNMWTSPDGRPHMLHYQDGQDEKHISVFDGESFSVLSANVDLPKGLEIKCLAFDRRGELVLGAEGAIALREDDSWKVIKSFGQETGRPQTLHDIVCDGDTMWIAASSSVYELRDGKVTTHNMPAIPNCLCKSGDVLWVGLFCGGLGRLEATTLTVSKKDNSPLRQDDVEELVSAEERVWIRTADRVPAFVRDGKIERLVGDLPVDEPTEKAAKKQKRA